MFTKRRMAIALLALPFLVALPLRYWIMNHAGSWVVSTELEPDHRAAFLGLTFMGDIIAISILSFFAASLLLFLDRWHRVVTGILTILLGVLLVPALLWVWITLVAYVKFG
jgi:hypothetical protein